MRSDEEMPYWQTRPCPAMCRVEHFSTDGYEERSCEGETRSTQLSLEKARYVEDRNRRDGYGLPVHLDVAARHPYRETEPLVMVWDCNYGEGGTRLYRLTLDEAEAFANAVLDAVKDARS